MPSLKSSHVSRQTTSLVYTACAPMQLAWTAAQYSSHESGAPPSPPPGPDDDGEIHMFMSSDDAHKFWQGKLNPTIALAKKQIKVQGPLSKLMKLLPAMQPAFGRYRTFLEEHGHQDMVQ